MNKVKIKRGKHGLCSKVGILNEVFFFFLRINLQEIGISSQNSPRIPEIPEVEQNPEGVTSILVKSQKSFIPFLGNPWKNPIYSSSPNFGIISQLLPEIPASDGIALKPREWQTQKSNPKLDFAAFFPQNFPHIYLANLFITTQGLVLNSFLCTEIEFLR